MFFNITTEQKVIVDFQLIYDTDNFVLLDVYAEGLRKEPTIWNRTPYFDRIGYGFLCANIQDHENYDEFFQTALKNRESVDVKTREMMRSVVQVHKWNRKIESELNEKNINFPNWLEYFKILTNMLSYKRLSDELDYLGFSEDPEKTQGMIQQIRLPSHMLVFHKAYSNLCGSPTEAHINNFINRFGFLFDFNMRRNSFEIYDELKTQIMFQLTDGSGLIPVRNKIRIDETNDFSLSLYKRIACYEEWRHYEQARAIRNYRNMMEMIGVSPYRTDINRLHETLERGDINGGCILSRSSLRKISWDKGIQYNALV